MNFKISFLIATLTLISTLVKAEKISYILSMPEPYTHYFEVEMKISEITKKEYQLKLPVWTPGSYMVREYAKNLEDVLAFDEKRNAISIEKTSKSTWKVISKGLKEITIKYKVYAFEMSVRHSFLDDSHAYINGTTLFMYAEGFQELNAKLKIIPHPNFKKISTGLEPLNADNKWELKAENYDELVDCPIEIGNHETFEFEAAGIKHEVAIYGEGNYDKERLAIDMKQIVETTTKVFGENPNKRYVFIVHNLTAGGGGLEHSNSTSLQVNRFSYQPDSKYFGFLSLTAHEYFHLWNVKRLRPKSLIKYNYEEENYTDLLWIFEGFTSYYDELLMLRAGFYTPEKYLATLASSLNYVENQPGGKVQALSMSSYDAWIKAYRVTENSFNTEISYYSKGALVGALLDVMVISATNGSKKLDDVMQHMYQTYYKKNNIGIDKSDFLKSFKSVCGLDVSYFVSNHVEGTETLPYPVIFEKLGLAVSQTTLKDEVELGARLAQNGNKLMITGLKRDASGYLGGLNVNDEIIALNGNRVDKTEFETLFSSFKVGDKVNILVSRDNLIKEISFQLVEGTKQVWKMAIIENASAQQQALREFWLKGN